MCRTHTIWSCRADLTRLSPRRILWRSQTISDPWVFPAPANNIHPPPCNSKSCQRQFQTTHARGQRAKENDCPHALECCAQLFFPHGVQQCLAAASLLGGASLALPKLQLGSCRMISSFFNAVSDHAACAFFMGLASFKNNGVCCASLAFSDVSCHSSVAKECLLVYP